MKREDLKALNLEDAVIDAVMALHGKSTEALKSNITTAQSETETLRNQLKEANTQIEGFKGMKKPEEVDAAVNEWKTKFEQAQKDAADQVATIKFDVALKDALKEHKVKDPADVIPHLKRDMLKLGDDGKFVGLSEQIEPLKTAKEYLFESSEPAPKIVAGGNNPKTNVPDALETAMFKGAGIKPPEG